MGGVRNRRIDKSSGLEAPGGAGSTKIVVSKLPGAVGSTKIMVWRLPGAVGSRNTVVWRLLRGGRGASDPVPDWRRGPPKSSLFQRSQYFLDLDLRFSEIRSSVSSVS